MNANPELTQAAEAAIAGAKKRGIPDVKAVAFRSRNVSVMWREGRPDRIQESSRQGLALSLYQEHRFTSCQTNDLRPQALERFLDTAVALCRVMTPDPFREITDPALYAGRSEADLALFDEAVTRIGTDERRAYVAEVEKRIKAEAGDRLISVEVTFEDETGDSVQLHSNGFAGSQTESQVWTFAELSLKDEGDRRPAGSGAVGDRRRRGLPGPEALVAEALADARARLGAKQVPTAKMVMILENKVAAKLVGQLLSAASGRALQQKASFLEGRLGQPIGSKLLDLTDDPLLVGGFGSRLFDGEGIAARPLRLFEQGVLRTFYIDTYYGKKLAMAPTTGSRSNLVMTPGAKDLAGLVAEVPRGILVKGFLGGNFNGTTGDFSLGVHGTLIDKGQLGHAVSEMNVAGNHKELWNQLIAVGNDPYPYSSARLPSLVFDGVQFAGE